MFRATFESALFGPGVSREQSNAAIAVMLDALYRLDLLLLQAKPNFPRLYDSGVRYRREPRGVEKWQDAAVTLARGYGDCEDLACWRAAELYTRDRIAAVPRFTWRRLRDGATMYHIQVLWPNGHVEDPSARLGMLDGLRAR